jgi:hypothetical protein
MKQNVRGTGRILGGGCSPTNVGGGDNSMRPNLQAPRPRDLLYCVVTTLAKVGVVSLLGL